MADAYHLTGSQVRRLLRMLTAFESGQLGGAIRDDSRPRLSGVILAKCASDVAKGASGTFTVYSGTTKGSEPASAKTIDAYCRAMAYTANTWAYLQPVDTGWEAVPADCP